MKTTITSTKPKTRPPRPQPVTPHSREWRRQAWKRYVEQRGSYWSQARRPIPCLMFVLPFLLLYEGAVYWFEHSLGTSVRTGADAWMRSWLAGIGLTDRWLPPLVVVLTLLIWQAVDARSWRFNGLYVLGMVAESAILALSLIGLNRLLDMAFLRIEEQQHLLSVATVAETRFAPLVGFIGAGIYEETLFRLALVPLTYRLLRLLQASEILSGTLAVSGSAMLFALAHHAGAPGEAFTWYAFIFRWLAGVVFAWIFLVRGFGIAVGTHAFYDIFVGSFGWRI